MPAQTACGCGTAACARLSPSRLRRSEERSRGSSRTGRPRLARTRAARRRAPSGSHASAATSAHSGERRRSRPHNRARADPRTTGSVSGVPAATSLRSPSTSDRDRPSSVPASGEVEAHARKKTTSPRTVGDLAHRVARHPQVPSNLLDRLPLHETLAPYPTNRLHHQHPPPPAHDKAGSQLARDQGGAIFHADPPPNGVRPCGWTE